MKINFSGRFYHAEAYGVNPETFRIDPEIIRQRALETHPAMIIGGWSAYPRIEDFKAMKEIADEVGAKFWVDMAHFAGLVAAGLHPSPVPYADVVSSTAHKTLGGPRSGFILAKQEYAKKLNSAVFPGQQGGPLMARSIAGQGRRLQSRRHPGIQRPHATHPRRAPRSLPNASWPTTSKTTASAVLTAGN